MLAARPTQQQLLQRLGLRHVPGEAVEQEALLASSSPSRSRTIATVTSSGTRSPRSMNSLAFRPSSVLLVTLYRKISPVEILGIARWEAMNWAVSLCPHRGARRGRCALSQETLIVALLQLALDLLHGIQPDADHDQQADAAELELVGDPDRGQRDQREQRDQAR